MQKISTMQASESKNFQAGQLTIGLDLGDRWSFYCVLDEVGKVILEQKLPTTPEASKQIFQKIPRSRIAMETGTHSPWLSRLLTELGHEVIVAHAQKVELITKSTRKDDRHDAKTLAHRSRVVGTSPASQRQSTTPSDGDPRASGVSAGANGISERRQGIGEVLWRKTA